MPPEILAALEKVLWGWDQKPSDDKTILEHFAGMSNKFWDAVRFLDCMVPPFQMDSTNTGSGSAGKGSKKIPAQNQLAGVGIDEGWVDAAIENAKHSVQVEEADWSADCWRGLYGKLYQRLHFSADVCISCLPTWADA